MAPASSFSDDSGQTTLAYRYSVPDSNYTITSKSLPTVQDNAETLQVPPHFRNDYISSLETRPIMPSEPVPFPYPIRIHYMRNGRTSLECPACHQQYCKAGNLVNHLQLKHGIPSDLAHELTPGSRKRRDNTDKASSNPEPHIPNHTGRYDDGARQYLPKLEDSCGNEQASPWQADASSQPFRIGIRSHSSSDEEPDTAEPDGRDRTASQTPSSDHSSASTEDYIDEIGTQIIDSIVLSVTRWLSTNFASAHQTTRGAGEASQSNSYQPAQSGQQNRPGPSRKRKSDDRINDSDGGEDNGDQDSLRISSDLKGENPQRRKFACPYFKYNPFKYQDWRNCPGPGWPDVHRVKEHLYRRHRQPRYRCGRCWQPFENEKDCIDHQRATEPCPLKDEEPVEGFDASQEQRLRSRKKTTNYPSEIAKWEAVFSILFPHVPEEHIPSPFYEYDQSTNAVLNSHDSLTECEEYILREVPLRLRQILRSEFDRDIHIIEESLKKKAIDKTRTLLAEVFREFRQIQQRGTIPEVEPEVIEAADGSGSNPTQAPPMALQDTGQNPPGAVNLNSFHFNSPVADNVGSNFTQTPPTVLQYNEQNLFEGTNVDDLQSWKIFFDPSVLDNVQASLSRGVTMEEIMQQPVGYTEQKKSDSGYESYPREDIRQEFSEGSE